jgi:hypothetical protein
MKTNLIIFLTILMVSEQKKIATLPCIKSNLIDMALTDTLNFALKKLSTH